METTNISVEAICTDKDETTDRNEQCDSAEHLCIISTLSLLDERNDEEKVVLGTDTIEKVSCVVIHTENDDLEVSKPSPEPCICMRKKLLILDVNGLLVHIVSPPPEGYKADLYFGRRAVFKRPFCVDFLKFCFERFEVAVWSSRNKKNLATVLNYLMEDLKHNLLFCWDLSHCTATKFKTLENMHKTLVFKDLKRIWEKHDSDGLWEKGDFDESNTLLLDDSPYKSLLNPPHTAVFPCSYKFNDASDISLGAGGDIRVYLERLAEAENIREFIEQNPFGQIPITEGNASWEFYREVMLSSFPATT